MNIDKALALIQTFETRLNEINEEYEAYNTSSKQLFLSGELCARANGFKERVEMYIPKIFADDVQTRDDFLYKLRTIEFYRVSPDGIRFDTWVEGWVASRNLLDLMRENLQLDSLDDGEIVAARSPTTKSAEQPESIDQATSHKARNSANVEKDSTNRVFIVHGHDESMKLQVSNFLYQLKLEPIILSDEVNGGFKSVMEKFEEHAESARFAIVLLSPDDYGYAKRDGEGARKPRARQNVILELGYFIGKLGRNNVIAFTKPDANNAPIEQPSDIIGGIIEQFEGNWQERIRKELKNAGYDLS